MRDSSTMTAVPCSCGKLDRPCHWDDCPSQERDTDWNTSDCYRGCVAFTVLRAADG